MKAFQICLTVFVAMAVATVCQHEAVTCLAGIVAAVVCGIICHE